MAKLKELPAGMTAIEERARVFSLARERLREIVDNLQAAMAALKGDELPKLRRAVQRAAEAHESLKAAIEAAPECFERPRTVVLHAVKVGYQKSKGRIEWEDADRVVALIRRHMPELAEAQIVTTERPVKDALNTLTAAELRRIGVTVQEGDDQVVIRPTDGAVDKIVEALLADATGSEGVL